MRPPIPSTLPRSWNDDRRQVTIPKEMSIELAEEIGIHLGDGQLKFCRPKRGGTEYRWIYTGHNREDRDYLLSHVSTLVSRLYNLRGSTYERPEKSELNLMYGSMAVFYFKSKILGLPVGPKYRARIPDVLLDSNDKSFYSACLRGLFDTDGSLSFGKNARSEYSDPILNFSTCSPSLASGTTRLLKNLGFRFYSSVYQSKQMRRVPLHLIWIKGRKQLHYWMMRVGFANLSKNTKFLVWKALGTCPPHTTLQERLLLLKENGAPILRPSK